MELSEKLMAITQKNDDVLERLEVINKYLEMLHFTAVLDKEGVESLYVSFMNEGGADILMDNIKRAINALSDNSFDLIEFAEFFEEISNNQQEVTSNGKSSKLLCNNTGKCEI